MHKLKPSLNRIAFVLIFILFGSVYISVFSQAISKISFEAESGSFSNASIGSDSLASNGQYLMFSSTNPPPDSSVFLETFDGKPTTPTTLNYIDWDMMQTVRDSGAWDDPPDMLAHHSADSCGDVAAGGHHTVTNFTEWVFQCNDHVMTSAQGDPGYAETNLTPPAMADWTNGPATIKFDVSTFHNSPSRDWIALRITPYDEQMLYPQGGKASGVDGSGIPASSLHFEQDNDYWRIRYNSNEIGALRTPYGEGPIPPVGDVQGKVVRNTVEIVIGNGQLTFRYPGTSASTTVNLPVQVTWKQAVFQMEHHSYTPDKDPAGPGAGGITHGTWHWDNVSINPAKRFYQRQANINGKDRTGKSSSTAWQTVTLSEPAPANAHLYFTGTCGFNFRDNAQDTSITTVTRLGSDLTHPEHTWNYRIPLQQGMTTIQFQFTDPDGSGWYEMGHGCHMAIPVIKAKL
jgi:hypothetical protein